MKVLTTAGAVLAAAAIFLSPAIASAVEGDGAGAATATATPTAQAPETPPVVAPVEGKASVETLPDSNVKKSAPVEAKLPEVVAPVAPDVPEPVVDQTKGTVLYLSQLPACDAGDGTVTSGGVPVNACIWAGSFVAIR
jgi:hypothetical protein